MNFKQAVLFLFSFFLVLLGYTQTYSTPESCDCTIDTAGYKSYLNTLTLNENAAFKFHVQNSNSTFAIAAGVIGNTTPAVVQNLINNYPKVTTIVMHLVPGSMDDDSNLKASKALKNKGYKMYLPPVNAHAQVSFIASGGVDMFLSGNVRVIDQGAEVGVHSWSDGTNAATDFPVGHANHQPYINYYILMGFSEQDAKAFYYFTINAAPPSGIHNMTEAELEQYKLRTCKYASTPTYKVTQHQNQLKANLSGASYQWINCTNKQPISGATNQSFTPTSNGSYAVIVTEKNCSDTSACYTVTKVNIEQVKSEIEFKLYPNPTSGRFSVELKNRIGSTQINIMTLDGKVIKQFFFEDQEKMELNPKLIPGIYLVQINNKQSSEIRKLFVAY